jgi:hypothetical protein
MVKFSLPIKSSTVNRLHLVRDIGRLPRDDDRGLASARERTNGTECGQPLGNPGRFKVEV